MPAWLATVGAFTAAGLTSWSIRIERERDAKRQAADDAAQAAAVAAWATNQLTYFETPVSGPLTMMSGWGGGVRVRNASTVPIYDANIRLYHQGRMSAQSFIAVIPPDSTELGIGFWREQGGDGFEEMVQQLRSPDGGVRWGDVDVELVFRDAAGRRWHRQLDGVLLLVAPGPVARRRSRWSWATRRADREGA